MYIYIYVWEYLPVKKVKKKKKKPIFFDCCLQNVQATKDKIDSNNVLVMTRVFRKFKQVLLLKNHHCGIKSRINHTTQKVCGDKWTPIC